MSCARAPNGRRGPGGTQSRPRVDISSPVRSPYTRSCARDRRSAAALRREPREPSRVRHTDLRSLLAIHEPASRRGRPRDRGHAAACRRAARRRSGGAVAVVGRHPGRHRTRPRLVGPGGPATFRAAAPGAVPLGGQASTGRPHVGHLLAGRAAGRGPCRPGDLPRGRHQVSLGPSTLGGGRAARRRPVPHCPAATAQLARRPGGAPAAGGAGPHQRARPQAPRAQPAGERGAPGPSGGLRRGGALDPGLPHGRLLAHRRGSGDLRVSAGRDRQHGASPGFSASRRLGPRQAEPSSSPRGRRNRSAWNAGSSSRAMDACAGSTPARVPAGRPAASQSD